MDLRCDEVREFLVPRGSPSSLSEEQAEAVAEHLDQCGECNQKLNAQVAEALSTLPASGSVSSSRLRQRARADRRASFFRRSAAAAAAILVLLATAWALLRKDPTPSRLASERVAPIRPVDEAIPDPPTLTQLRDLDRRLIQSEGVLALYLQFCLSCLNSPTDEDKHEFLIRALLVFREVRGAMRSRYERGGDAPPEVDLVTREGLSEALQTMRSSPLPSVKLLPARITGFKMETPQRWHVDHLLGTTSFRLTLDLAPSYLSLWYLKTALRADDALMGRIEEALWFDTFVNLPKRLVDKDPSIAPKTLEALLPLLSPRQQKIYRKIVGPT
jgi:hypothetical protein